MRMAISACWRSPLSYRPPAAAANAAAAAAAATGACCCCRSCRGILIVAVVCVISHRLRRRHGLLLCLIIIIIGTAATCTPPIRSRRHKMSFVCGRTVAAPPWFCHQARRGVGRDPSCEIIHFGPLSSAHRPHRPHRVGRVDISVMSQCAKRPGQTSPSSAVKAQGTKSSTKAKLIAEDRALHEGRNWSCRKFVGVTALSVIALWVVCFGISALFTEALIRVSG